MIKILPIKNLLKKNWLIISLLLIFFFSRLLVFNKEAAGFWADESRYPQLITNLDDASKSGNYLLLIKKLFNVDARPGLGLFYYPAAFLEWTNPSIPFGLYYNLLINVLLLLLIFLIVKKVQNKNTAVVVTVLVAFSLASLIYIRHTLPYDIALLLLLGGLYLYVYFKKAFAFGLLAGFSFLTYPSYYYYIIPIPFILFLYKKSIKSASLFIFGFVCVLITAQLISYAIAENSYFRSLKDQSGGVTAISQGDYILATSYIAEYILAADGYWYLFLILAGVASILLIKDKRKLVFFGLYLLSVFLILELFSHILQKHVLYGRTVRPLYLLTLGSSALVLERVLSNFKSKKVYIFGVSILLLISVINWFPKFLTFKNLTYPKQFQQKAKDYLTLKIDRYEIKDAYYVNYWDTNSPDPKLIDHFFGKGEPGKFYTINAVQTFPYFGNLNLDNFCKNEVLLKQPHIQYEFRPYQFEGYKKAMRDKMESEPLYYQLIYCN